MGSDWSAWPLNKNQSRMKPTRILERQQQTVTTKKKNLGKNTTPRTRAVKKQMTHTNKTRTKKNDPTYDINRPTVTLSQPVPLTGQFLRIRTAETNTKHPKKSREREQVKIDKQRRQKRYGNGPQIVFFGP